MSLFDSLFDTTNFSPHGFCLYWEPGLLSAMVVVQSTIAVAYVLIPAQLMWFVYKQRWAIPLPRWAVGLFAAFILLCGASHAIDVVTLWRPYYWFQVLELLLTAVVSMAVALLFPLAHAYVRARRGDQTDD